MATLQVRDIDDNLYNFLKTSAKIQNRSISQEVITILETYSSNSNSNFKNATKEFLELTGAWKDDKTADEIVNDIKKSRSSSRRFGDENGIFD